MMDRQIQVEDGTRIIFFADLLNFSHLRFRKLFEKAIFKALSV